MKFLDTQVVSYAMKGAYSERITRCHIPSIVARELLLMDGPVPGCARYYVPLKNGGHGLRSCLSLDHRYHKALTDQFVLDFGNGRCVTIYGNMAVATLVNSGDHMTLRKAIQLLDKKEVKKIRRRFSYIVKHQLRCVPLGRRAVAIGLDLLSEFLSRYNAKKNLTNTLNDVLILACTIEHGGHLITEDSLLKRFAAEMCQGTVEPLGRFVRMSFNEPRPNDRRRPFESKGYINRGWRFQFLRTSNK